MKMEEHLITKKVACDVLIIGGGTAGCYAALTLSENSDLSIVIAEKANIKRSGCLAAGVNAINAYITKGHVPQDYVDYATKDAAGIVSGCCNGGIRNADRCAAAIAEHAVAVLRGGADNCVFDGDVCAV